MTMRLMPVCLLVLGAGCALFDADAPAVRLQTDQAAYDLSAAKSITITARNPSTAVVYFSTCMPIALEALEKKQVVATLGFPACECICLTQLDPGETWRHTVSIDWIAQHGDRLPLHRDARYRLRLAFFEDEALDHLLDFESLYTNHFALSR